MSRPAEKSVGPVAGGIPSVLLRLRRSLRAVGSPPLAPPALERFIQWGLIALVAVMPFHAFLTVWLGSIIGHRAIIQSWKELLLILMCGAAIAMIVRRPQLLDRLRRPSVLALAGFMAVALAVTA